MDNSNLIIVLAIATLIAGLGFAIWQFTRAQRAKSEHHHSAITKGHPEQRSTAGAPGVPPQ